MEQSDIYYIAKYWEDLFHYLVSGPWLDPLGAEGMKNALHDNRKSNKESYEVVRQSIEVYIC